MSNATEGGLWLGARSFAIPLTTTSAPVNGADLAPGSYKLSTDAETYVTVGSGNQTAPDLGAVSSQPAVGSENRTFHMPAGSVDFVEVGEASTKIAARAKSGTGTLFISGPVRKAAIP